MFCPSFARHTTAIAQKALYVTYLACHASKSTNTTVNIDPLAGALQQLHDHLLSCLRRLVDESITEPAYSLALTNSFIALGNDSFLNAVCNDKDYAPDRDLVLTAARLLLIRFEHPDMVPLPRRNCTVPSCSQQQVYQGLCSRHAALKYRTMFAKPTFQSVVRSPELVGKFNAWVVARASGSTAPASASSLPAVGPQPQLPAHLHPNLMAFHRAVQQFRAITSRDLRTSRARTIIDKYLLSTADKFVGLHVAPPQEVAALEAAVDAAEGLSDEPALPSLPSTPRDAPGGIGGATSSAAASFSAASSSSLEEVTPSSTPSLSVGGMIPSLNLGSLSSGAGGAPAAAPLSTARLGPGAVSSKLFAGVHARVLMELDALFQHEFVPSTAYTDMVASVSAAVLGTNSRGGKSIRRVTDAQGLASMLWTADIIGAQAAQQEMQHLAAQETARRTGVQPHVDTDAHHPLARFAAAGSKK